MGGGVELNLPWAWGFGEGVLSWMSQAGRSGKRVMKGRQGLDRALVRPSIGGRGNVWVLFQERLETLQHLESPGCSRGGPPPNSPCAPDFPSISFRLGEGWGPLPAPRARVAVRPAPCAPAQGQPCAPLGTWGRPLGQSPHVQPPGPFISVTDTLLTFHARPSPPHITVGRMFSKKKSTAPAPDRGRRVPRAVCPPEPTSLARASSTLPEANFLWTTDLSRAGNASWRGALWPCRCLYSFRPHLSRSDPARLGKSRLGKGRVPQSLTAGKRRSLESA